MSPSWRHSGLDELVPIRNAADLSCNSGLERLPPEVRRSILSILDLSHLKALVYASPVFHQQYLLDRRYILSASIDLTLQSVCLDAYAVQQSENCTAPDHPTGVLEAWEKGLSLRPTIAVTEQEAVHMVARYFQTVVPIAKHFARQALNGLVRRMKEYEDDPAQNELEPQPPLGDTEWFRCLRAVYRFQLLCNVVRPIPGSHRGDRAHRAELVFHALSPWEVEELFAVYQFAQAVYDHSFIKIEDEVRLDHLRFFDRDRPPTPDGAFEVHVEWERNNLLEGTILRGGLDLLCTVIFEIECGNLERLVSLMQRNIVSSHIPINAMEGILGQARQIMRRNGKRTMEDRMTQKRAPMLFAGDDLNKPPLGWTLIWNGTYSNLFPWSTSDEMREWAYVFWDAERIQKWSGGVLLTRQWEECWLGEDPRDQL